MDEVDVWMDGVEKFGADKILSRRVRSVTSEDGDGWVHFLCRAYMHLQVVHDRLRDNFAISVMYWKILDGYCLLVFMYSSHARIPTLY